MGERKVLNKYFPPDFDPSQVPRKRMDEKFSMNIRMMMPMSIQCNACGDYLYKGKKFNTRKETILGDTYLGLRIYRFYFKCTACNSVITIKTD